MAQSYDGPIEKIDDYHYRIPADARRGMRADGLIFADEKLLELIKDDATLSQVANVACLPGLVGSAMAMPDAHQGYGFPIGGVAAFDVNDGVMSPGGVGYDINCGVRLMRSDLRVDDIEDSLEDLADALFSRVPAGVGKSGQFKVSKNDLQEVLRKGAAWAVSEGYGENGDLDHCEGGGFLEGADPSALSKRAMDRGAPQLGTLGSGNHFLEIQRVQRIQDPDAARAFGIEETGQVCVMIHCGSRGLGHQVCDDAVDTMLKAASRYGIELPDKQLACAPVDSPEADEYYSGMACAANYAWANRQVITHQVREAFQRTLRAGPNQLGLRLVYDVAHNVAKFEEHDVDGTPTRLCVHRKGATRGFGPGHPEVPDDYRDYGQPVLIPGDMSTGSFVLTGTDRAMTDSWGSTCHGAGRVMSRNAATKRAHSNQVAAKLQDEGVVVRSVGKKTLAEEAPYAYKVVDDVVDVCAGAGISKVVARLMPLAVIKG
ncbi:MAG: RtcB family protein [Armatimonadota bacterium]